VVGIGGRNEQGHHTEAKNREFVSTALRGEAAVHEKATAVDGATALPPKTNPADAGYLWVRAFL
jgi:plasmid stability protein